MTFEVHVEADADTDFEPDSAIEADDGFSSAEIEAATDFAVEVAAEAEVEPSAVATDSTIELLADAVWLAAVDAATDETAADAPAETAIEFSCD